MVCLRGIHQIFRRPAMWPLLTVALLAGCSNGLNRALLSTPTGPDGAPPTPQQVGSVTISPQNAEAGPGQTLHFRASQASPGPLTWTVNGVPGGNATNGTIDANGNFVAPSGFIQSGNVVVGVELTNSPQANYATSVVTVMRPGVVTRTANPMVAEYSIYLPQAGSMKVQFGPDTNYGLETWSVSTPSTPDNNGGVITIQVAGMRGSSTYHMQGVITLANGLTFTDSDHTFTTGAARPTVPVQVTNPGGTPPQPGVELIDTIPLGSVPIPGLAQAFATDLQGNVIWTYNYTGSPANIIFPIKPLPNGHFLMVIGYVPSVGGNAVPNGVTTVPPGTISVVREVDLEGNTIRELSIDQLNQSLAAQGYTGLNLLTFCTDVLMQPNGHMVVIAWMKKTYTDLPGYPGSTDVLGNVVVDVDQNYKPTWVWNSFDHLDINRHPFMFPDFTHANALLYSPEDHNLLLSLRQQNWILKLDYQDGTGTGNILWHLGEGGDFKLIGGTDPTDWFYAQHGMNFFGPNTSGIFTLGMVDNGDDRMYPSGLTCGMTGAPACYSSSPVYQINEAARTATLVSRYTPSPAVYSYFAGQTDLLQNGDIESAYGAAIGGALVQEFRQTSPTAAQVIWQLHTPGYDAFRAFRIPSLYPGVQW